MIALDSNVLIYFLEKNPSFFEAAKNLFIPVLAGDVSACMSVLTITEIIAGSSPDANLEILDHVNLVVQPINKEIAHMAGVIRLQYHLKAPDALRLATALYCKANMFYTNDAQLAKLNQIETLTIRSLV
jgi:predicted nucleic acid-binding protein